MILYLIKARRLSRYSLVFWLLVNYPFANSALFCQDEKLFGTDPYRVKKFIPVDDFVVPRDDILMFQTVNEDCGFYQMSFICFDFNIDQYLFLYSSPTSL